MVIVLQDLLTLPLQLGGSDRVAARTGDAAIVTRVSGSGDVGYVDVLRTGLMTAVHRDRVYVVSDGEDGCEEA
jgi:hypothetical protein